MAKRTPPNTEDYRPVNEQLARSVLSHRRQPTDENGERSEPLEAHPPAPPMADEPSPEPSKPSEEPPQRKALSSRRRKAAKGNAPSKETVRAKRKELVREKRMLLTVSEDELFQGLVVGISSSLRVTVKSSNVLRACLTLLLHVQDELLKQCRRMEPLQRPRNDEPTSIVAFEEDLARIFDSAIRNTKSPE
jgi:flagellar motor protein MotB